MHLLVFCQIQLFAAANFPPNFTPSPNFLPQPPKPWDPLKYYYYISISATLNPFNTIDQYNPIHKYPWTGWQNLMHPKVRIMGPSSHYLVVHFTFWCLTRTEIVFICIAKTNFSKLNLKIKWGDIFVTNFYGLYFGHNYTITNLHYNVITSYNQSQ